MSDRSIFVVAKLQSATEQLRSVLQPNNHNNKEVSFPARLRTSGPRSSGLLRILITVSVTVTRLISRPHACVHTFPFNIAAIYLAKRNIRKKGLLELHEQVRRSRPERSSRPLVSTEVLSHVRRSTTTVFTSG